LKRTRQNEVFRLFIPLCVHYIHREPIDLLCETLLLIVSAHMPPPTNHHKQRQHARCCNRSPYRNASHGGMNGDVTRRALAAASKLWSRPTNSIFHGMLSMTVVFVCFHQVLSVCSCRANSSSSSHVNSALRNM